MRFGAIDLIKLCELLETSKTYQCFLGDNLEDVTMDNQQPSISEFELGWLCGIIDGEGCIGLWSRGGSRKEEYKPGVRLTNTDENLISTYCQVLDKIGVSYHITKYEGRNSRCKSYQTVTIEGFKRLVKLLPVIKDKLIAKKPQALLLDEWVSSRASKWHRSEYSTRELEIPKLIAQYNYRGEQK